MVGSRRERRAVASGSSATVFTFAEELAVPASASAAAAAEEAPRLVGGARDGGEPGEVERVDMISKASKQARRIVLDVLWFY